MELISQITIPNPPIKYVKKVTKRRKGSKKKSLEDVYYLTANLFYTSDVHFSVRSEIVNAIKEYLLNFIKPIPKLTKMSLDIIYQRETDNFDLDNKIYFWQKIILDLLKTPSKKEIQRAINYNRKIKSLNVVKDDSCKYITELNSKYKKGTHLMIINIYGILEKEEINLFTNN